VPARDHIGIEEVHMASARSGAFLFDLDGTLVDSVYGHVRAWREALEQVGIELSVWRIHRRIGMSGGLLINALLRETGAEISSHFVEELQHRHADAYARRSAQVRPLPGTKELLEHLTSNKVRWVATSGRMASARPSLRAIGVDPAHAPVITRTRSSVQSSIRTSLSPRANNLQWMLPTLSWSGIACGICWPRAALAHSASAFSRAGTAGKNSSARERIASTRIRAISFVLSTRSVCAAKRNHTALCS
jgi:hypothetical protein